MSRPAIIGTVFAILAGFALVMQITLDVALLNGFDREGQALGRELAAVERAFSADWNGRTALLTGLRPSDVSSLDEGAAHNLQMAQIWGARYDREVLSGGDHTANIWYLRRASANLYAAQGALLGRASARWAALARHLFLFYVLGFVLLSVAVLRNAWVALQRHSLETPTAAQDAQESTHAKIHALPRRDTVRRAA